MLALVLALMQGLNKQISFIGLSICSVHSPKRNKCRNNLFACVQICLILGSFMPANGR